MKKILTERRLCELAGLAEAPVGPTGTQEMDPTGPDDDPDATQKLPSVQDSEIKTPSKVTELLTTLSKEMEGNEEMAPAKEVVDWLNDPERTPRKTMTVVDRVSDPLTGRELEYIHTNPFNNKKVILMNYKPFPIQVGTELDGGYPEHWSGLVRQYAKELWHRIHNEKGWEATMKAAQYVRDATEKGRGEKYSSRSPDIDLPPEDPESQRLIRFLSANL